MGKVIRLLLCLLALTAPLAASAQGQTPGQAPACAQAQEEMTCCCGPQECPCSVESDPGPQAQSWLPAPSGPAQPLPCWAGLPGPVPLLVHDQGPGHALPAWRPPQPIYLRLATLLI